MGILTDYYAFSSSLSEQALMGLGASRKGILSYIKQTATQRPQAHLPQASAPHGTFTPLK